MLIFRQQIGNADLYHGDCMSVLQRLGDACVDMVLADLPYGTTNCKWDTPLPLNALWEEYSRVCRGPVLLFAQTPFDKVLGSSNLSELRYEWIWEKSHATGHLNSKKAPLKAHENVLVFYRKQPTYNPIMTHGHVRKKAVKRGCNTDVYGAQTSEDLLYDSTSRYPRSVLRFPSDKQRVNLHPTQKPLALCEYLIRTYTNAGDVVLDNVMGSGTTGVAALAADRRFIGIELNAKFFHVACERMGVVK